MAGCPLPLRDIPVAVGQYAPRHTLDLARLALAFFSLMSSTLLNSLESLHVRPVLDATPMHALIYGSARNDMTPDPVGMAAALLGFSLTALLAGNGWVGQFLLPLFRIAAMEQIEARRGFTHAVAAHHVSHTGFVAKSTTKT